MVATEKNFKLFLAYRNVSSCPSLSSVCVCVCFFLHFSLSQRRLVRPFRTYSYVVRG